MSLPRQWWLYLKRGTCPSITILSFCLSRMTSAVTDHLLFSPAELLPYCRPNTSGKKQNSTVFFSVCELFFVCLLVCYFFFTSRTLDAVWYSGMGLFSGVLNRKATKHGTSPSSYSSGWRPANTSCCADALYVALGQIHSSLPQLTAGFCQRQSSP